MEIDESKINDVILTDSFHFVYDKRIYSTHVKCKHIFNDGEIEPDLQKEIDEYKKIFIQRIKDGNVVNPVKIRKDTQ